MGAMSFFQCVYIRVLRKFSPVLTKIRSSVIFHKVSLYEFPLKCCRLSICYDREDGGTKTFTGRSAGIRRHLALQLEQVLTLGRAVGCRMNKLLIT